MIIELPLSMVDPSIVPRARGTRSTRLRSHKNPLKIFRSDYTYIVEHVLVGSCITRP